MQRLRLHLSATEQVPLNFPPTHSLSDLGHVSRFWCAVCESSLSSVVRLLLTTRIAPQRVTKKSFVPLGDRLPPQQVFQQ